jgi:hypothetical protein
VLESSDAGREIECALQEMRTIVPDRWASFVFPELEQMAREVLYGGRCAYKGERDDLGLARLTDVFALKTVRLLAGRTCPNTSVSVGSTVQTWS